MTHYLRIASKTLVDIDASKTDLHVVIDIATYSMKLLAMPYDDRAVFIADMARLQELRGEWQESHNPMSPDVFVASILKPMAEKWNLGYVTD